MKKIFLTVAMAMMCSAAIFAQSPNKINYQAVARDNSGNTLPNTAVSFRLSVLQGSATGTSVYSETHNLSTNAYGLANTLMQTAMFKPKLRNKKIRNMFYAGQLTVPGPGVPPSIISGQIAANELNKYLNQ